MFQQTEIATSSKYILFTYYIFFSALCVSMFGVENFGITILLRWGVRHELMRIFHSGNDNEKNLLWTWGFDAAAPQDDLLAYKEQRCIDSFYPATHGGDLDRWGEVADSTFLAHVLGRTIIVVQHRTKQELIDARTTGRDLKKLFVIICRAVYETGDVCFLFLHLTKANLVFRNRHC